MPVARSSDLLETISAYCSDALAAVAEYLASRQGPPKISFHVIEHEGPNATRGGVESRVYWQALAVSPGIRSLPSYVSAAGALAKDPTIAQLLQVLDERILDGRYQTASVTDWWDS